MNKKLKIQFWIAEKALAMQILEQEGSFCNSAHIQIGIPELCGDDIYLCEEDERDNLNHVSVVEFVSNELRDVYLNNVIHWISEEQFAMRSGKVKVGELCEARVGNRWENRRLLAILPERYKERFIVEMKDCPTEHASWNYARPITERTEPKIEECGNVVTYTWEEK